MSLHGPERKGFVRREQMSSIEGDTEYAFLHILVHEVAYGQIPRAALLQKHRLAAECIEARLAPCTTPRCSPTTRCSRSSSPARRRAPHPCLEVPAPPAHPQTQATAPWHST